jgi:catalase
MVRLYACNYNNCKNSYGTLNHLNAHITFKRHGPKRKPEEFKQIRELYKLQKTQDKNKILDTLGDKTELPVFHQQRGYNGYGRHDHTLNKKELEKLA